MGYPCRGAAFACALGLIFLVSSPLSAPGTSSDSSDSILRHDLFVQIDPEAHALLATAYHRLGRTAEAKAALAKTMELRPGTTAVNISLDPKNASPLYTEAAQRVVNVLVGIGLPEK